MCLYILEDKKMDCKDVKKVLLLFINNELPEDKNIKIKEHVEKCIACGKELKLFGKSWDLLENTDKISPSITFKSKIWQKISEMESIASKEIK